MQTFGNQFDNSSGPWAWFEYDVIKLVPKGLHDVIIVKPCPGPERSDVRRVVRRIPGVAGEARAQKFG
jgi:hypothetical protein